MLYLGGLKFFFLHFGAVIAVSSTKNIIKQTRNIRLKTDEAKQQIYCFYFSSHKNIIQNENISLTTRSDGYLGKRANKK